eukprot:jgi/Astpho2/3758/fgenesh1_pg.00060_%23_58_t
MARHTSQHGTANACQAEAAQNQFSWTKQWYPVASTFDLDDSRPHAVMLMGMELVLWKDSSKQWRCFQDLCPHRKVPLSEGRVHQDSNSLECAYHGWQFGPDGQAVVIPQIGSTDKKAEQVQQDLIWVWPESGPGAAEESLGKSPALGTLLSETRPDKWLWTYQHFVRDVPGSFDVWMENQSDQSHACFTHSVVSTDRFSSGDVQSYQLWIYATPTTANSTRLIICAGIDQGQGFPLDWKKKLQKPLGLLRTAGHLHLHNVTDGDCVFLHSQAEAIRAADMRLQPGSFSRLYYMPASADRGSSAFRRWWETTGGGGPRYQGAGAVAEPLRHPVSGLPDRETILNRHAQHTSHCSACQATLRQLQTAKQAATWTGVASLLGMSACLGRGAEPLSVQVLLLAALAAACGAAVRTANYYNRKFMYVGWEHSQM